MNEKVNKCFILFVVRVRVDNLYFIWRVWCELILVVRVEINLVLVGLSSGGFCLFFLKDCFFCKICFCCKL